MTDEPCKSVAIYGAGAIGLDLAAGLIQAGHRVTVIARGETYHALKSSGFAYQSGEEKRFISSEQFAVVDTTQNAEQQDYVFLTLKADALLEIVENLPPLFHEDTAVISATNGIPPWYSHLQDDSIGRFPFTREPRTKFLSSVEPERIIGMTIGRSVNRDGPAPVVVTHTAGTGHRIGELNHEITDRLIALAMLLETAGFSVDVSENIHRDIWTKLLGNVCVNPLSVLTEDTIGKMLDTKQVRSQMEKIVGEAHQVGLKLGVIQQGDFAISDFIRFAQNHLSEHETSMLQDFKNGRSLEVHRIVDVIIMLAELDGVDVPVPELRLVQSLLNQKIDARDLLRAAERTQGMTP